MAAVAKQPTIAGGNLTVVDALPSSTLTPNFFNSIFNDGMNPFDEYFAASSAAVNPNSLQNTSIRKDNHLQDKPRLVKDETLPTINTKLDQTLTPEQSPKSLNASDSLTQLRLTRSPSPFTFSIATTFPDSPVSSITPITSPEELTPNNIMSRDQAAGGSSSRYRKSISVQDPDQNVVAASHARTMSLPQNWNSKLPTHYATNSDDVGVEDKPSTSRARRQTLPKGVECQVKPFTRSRQRSDTSAPQLVSRMDGIFVTEAIPSAEIKAEPLSPASASFQSAGSSSKAGRKRKMSSVVDEDEDEEDSKLNETDKRARFLERNRIAASKCRKKKKIMNQRLEEKSRVLVQQNRFLNATLVKLRGDVLRLKQMVLTHHACGNPAIEQYLQQESHRYLVADNEEAAKKREAETIGKPTGLNGMVNMETNNYQQASSSSGPAWLSGFRSFEEVESEALKQRSVQSNSLEFNDDDFQKLLIGDQLTMMDDDFAPSPPNYE